MAVDKVLELSKDNFEEEVFKCSIPVLVDFWASWCGPCRAVAPIISELAEEYDGRFKIAKVNVDKENILASDFNIRTIPTMITFKDGKEVEKVIGARSKDDLKGLLEKHI